MLSMIDNKEIKEELKTYNISADIEIYTRTLFKENIQGKTALFIHGGGSGGNHTMLVRPAKWMIDKGIFSTIILPDRRGAGLSSPLNQMMNYRDNAVDMKSLLDSMGIEEKVTAIGISYGGPIALTLAGIDPRIDEVILVASSPSLKPAKGLWGFMYRHNMLAAAVRPVYKKLVGKMESVYPDFDRAYDAKNIGELKKLFLDMVKRTPKERFESLMFEHASTCNLDNQRIPMNIKISAPVYRIIGTKDETWEVETGDDYKQQIPKMKTRYIHGAGHKDVFFRADEFYEALYELLNEKDSYYGI